MCVCLDRSLNVPLVLASDGSAESNPALLLAGECDRSERGEPRNAFDGEHLTVGHGVYALHFGGGVCARRAVYHRTGSLLLQTQIKT